MTHGSRDAWKSWRTEVMTSSLLYLRPNLPLSQLVRVQLCECLTCDVNKRFSTFLSGCSNLSCFGARGSLFLLRTPPMPSPWFSSRCVSCLVSDSLGYSTRGLPLEYSSLGFVPSVSFLRSVSVFLRFLSRTSRPLASPKCCECSLVFL